jgi:hypothetical protein
MSEDRLDKALNEMRQEEVEPGTLEAARTRVWSALSAAGSTGASCEEFRSLFPAYLGGELAGSRRVLLEDHLGRCAACRSALAAARGGSRVVAMPQRARSSSRLVRWTGLAAAAAVFLTLVYTGRDAIDAMMAPGGPRATVVSAEGALNRLPSGALRAGAAIGERETVRTGPGAHAVLRLADGSTVDVNERTELFVTAAWSGQSLHLQRGDVVVRAARQRRGHLRVLTRDSIASVKGTVFAVSAGLGGSVVSVVEGSVAVSQPGKDLLLSPGQQAASNPSLASSVAEAVSWSPSAEEYLEILGSLVKIERQLAEHLPRDLRTSSALLPYLPAGTLVYGAVPNLGGTIGHALSLADQQSAENAAFGAWWASETGRLLRQLVDRLQSVSSLLGDEIVFCASGPTAGGQVPIVMARVQPGRQADLKSALADLFAGTGEPAPPYSVSEDLMVVSNSPARLAWAVGHLGQGANSPFAAAIGERYRRGVGWLMAMDAPPVVRAASGDDAPPVEFAGMLGMKYLFLEQRTPAGPEENELTLAFHGQRSGMASWLADTGSGGAAEYLPADALVAGYLSTREPAQLFGEFTALMTRENASFGPALALANEKLGAGFLESLTTAMGTEAAFALNGFSVNGPTWVMAALANSPSVIDASLQKLVETFNAEVGPGDHDKRIVFGQENAGGRVWGTMKLGALPFGLTWTYDGGYLVAASDRASAERAIATRNGGSPLVWSQAFLGQLPSSAGMHPSAFAWVNTKGALGAFTALAPNPALTKLLGERDPVLVVFDGTAQQIHAASRTRLSGLILDAVLLQSVSRTRQGM